ncbi:MAG: PEP/pyruvate-binding domain-containing protein [Nanoarchaeota archaeon]
MVKKRYSFFLDKNDSLDIKPKRLIELKDVGYNIPDLFVLNHDVYNKFSQPIKSRLETILKNSNNPDKEIKDLFMISKFSIQYILEINDLLQNDKIYAVRSSGNISYDDKIKKEDSPKSSLAGQFESFLYVKPKNIENAIKLCYASLFNKRTISLFGESNSFSNSSMAIICQEMIIGDKSAVMMTKNPVTGSDEFLIEATYGACESIVNGTINCDLYLIKEGQIIYKTLGNKEKYIGYSDLKLKPLQKKTPIYMQKKWCLNKKEIFDLFKIGQQIEQKYGAPQDIEVVFKGNIPYIVQTRNIVF